MLAIIIMIGATVYKYDNLEYPDWHTCEYHKEQIEELLFTSKENVTVKCTIK